MNEIGLIGLGNIGGGMCKRLLDRGIAVVGFDVSSEAANAAAELGAKIEPSPGAVAQRVDVVVTSLPNPAIVRDVYLGSGGLVAKARRGSTLIETSTIDPHTIRHVAEAAAAAGVDILDVALSGEPPQAILGELVFQVGGADDLIDRHLDLLQVLAKKINRTGGIGTAKTVKLVNNLMSLGNVAVAAEAFVLGVKCGMEPKRLYDILSVSGGRSAHFISGFQKVIEGEYRASFKTSLALKDINLILDLAKEEHYAVQLAPVIASLYRNAVEQGLGEDNFTSVVKGYEATAGIQVGTSR
ncbi:MULTISPECIES: NAD(P)-dependent oxidoreductase [unclassified Methylibium]|uniref:NAD(P)-dependent oxidoreductase n=1 Tax=unclassified Methylibium TaxID=2633235 RepID=UPI0003F43F43|nr:MULTISPECIES: NAD(P)-dependent oxidoreductase [unclassified Methylibium]EWS54385.1 2-(hydroxymethyl)glutarate dehydrogenase [Methylibium sp. T29]EWS58717.1 2-(hydroxymethyl)glutarate dehydrogenase [Methylibium sp. T29-B]